MSSHISTYQCHYTCDMLCRYLFLARHLGESIRKNGHTFTKCHVPAGHLMDNIIIKHKSLPYIDMVCLLIYVVILVCMLSDMKYMPLLFIGST